MGILLEDRGAFLRLAVVVVDLLNACGGGKRLDERLRGRREIFLPGYLDRATGAAQRGSAVFPVLHLLEAAQHVGIAPACTASRGPVVIVLAVAADEQYAVDRAGTTEDPATGLRDLPAQCARLRGSVVTPVQALLQRGDIVEDGDHPRLPHQPREVRPAGLQQDDAGTRLGETFRQHASGAAGPCNDVVGGLIHSVLATDTGEMTAGLRPIGLVPGLYGPASRKTRTRSGFAATCAETRRRPASTPTAGTSPGAVVGHAVRSHHGVSSKK